MSSPSIQKPTGWPESILASFFTQLPLVGQVSPDWKLQQGYDSDILSEGIAYVQAYEEEMRKAELLRQHPYAISQNKDGYWRTYLPDATKKNGRRQLKKKTKEALESEIIKYWTPRIGNPTVEEVFHAWNDFRLEQKAIQPATHMRLKQQFKRYFGEFGKRRIRNIKEDEVIEFLEKQIGAHELTAASFANLKSLTRGMLRYAKRKKYIDFGVESMLDDLDISDKCFKVVMKEDYEEVFDQEEMEKMISYLLNHLDIQNLGILLLFLSGIRVGELVALKHTDFVGDGVITIRRTETRYKDESGRDVYEIKEFPKTKAGWREVLIPEGYEWLEEKLQNSNPDKEYIFFSRGKRMTTNSIRRRLERICKNLNIYQKSPHKIRKTFASILLDSGIDKRLIVEVMGHTKIAVTEKSYHRNRRNRLEKRQILSRIPELKGNVAV